MEKHIVKSYTRDLDNLHLLIQQMGTLTLSQLQATTRSIQTGDKELADSVIDGDKRIDEFERKIDSETIKLLALRQPMAQDLRSITSAIKIAAALERIGDYAKNIARRSITLSKLPIVESFDSVEKMAKIAYNILKNIMTAYDTLDVNLAIKAWHKDDELDALYNNLYPEILEYIMQHPEHVTAATHLLFAAKNIERIADHATNIAGYIHFMVTGQPLDETRSMPKTMVHAHMGPLDFSANQNNVEDIIDLEEINGLEGWQLCKGKNTISQNYIFPDFITCWGAMSKIALKSEALNYPIIWKNNYNRLEITLSIHDKNKINQKDIDFAKYIDQICLHD